MVSLQDLDVRKMDHVIEIFRTVRKELGIKLPKDGKTVRFTPPQRRANHDEEWVAPLAMLHDVALPAESPGRSILET